MRRWAFVTALFALGLTAATFATRGGSTTTGDGTLAASVGPGYAISLTQGGAAVTTLPPGTYTVDVSDNATIHNFHLSGPGVDQSTSVSGTGSTTWTVTFAPGAYHYQCDPHSPTLHGDFTVAGGGGTTTTAETTTPAPTTVGETTVAQTTTAAAQTTTMTTTPQTTTATAAPRLLAARLSAVRATRARIVFTVRVSLPGKATVELLDRHGKRRARLSTRVRRTARLTLHPRHRLAPGRYLLRVRLAAGNRSTTTSHYLRVS